MCGWNDAINFLPFSIILIIVRVIFSYWTAFSNDKTHILCAYDIVLIELLFESFRWSNKTRQTTLIVKKADEIQVNERWRIISDWTIRKHYFTIESINSIPVNFRTHYSYNWAQIELIEQWMVDENIFFYYECFRFVSSPRIGCTCSVARRTERRFCLRKLHNRNRSWLKM